ncbi:MAG: DUF975 family protein [Ruminiclostridium sp.]|nr:DUF975 family protein [Ruminiclostridium sp.]
MTYQFPHRRELKFQAKHRMSHTVSMRVTLIVVCLLMASIGIRFLLDANLTYGLVNLNQYKDTSTGVYFNDNGFSLLFRMDLTQTVLAVPLTYHQITLFLIVSVVSFFFLAPLRVGAMEVYWSILRNGQSTVPGIFQWLTKIGRLGKSLVVEFVLQVGVRLAGLVCLLPSLYLYYLFYSNVTTLKDMTYQMSLIQSLAGLLAVAAGVFAFWLHSLFLPVRYCLASHPEYSLGETFRRGLLSTKGYRGAFFRFRLSMLPWYFLSQVTYNALDLYAMPYTSMASMLYIQEVAKARQVVQSQPLEETP